MSDRKPEIPGMDAFAKLWTDWADRFKPAGAPAGNGSNEFVSQMRKAFFDTLSKQADEFMRSDAFLAAMKQTMDGALAWQQMINQFLQKNLGAAQMPTKADADHIAMLLRGIEDRLAGKLDSLGRRVERLEGKPPVTKTNSRGKHRPPAAAKSSSRGAKPSRSGKSK